MQQNQDEVQRGMAWARAFRGFETPRLYVRPLTATDDTLLFEAMQNPRVNSWIGGFEKPFTLASARRWLAPRLDRMERGEGVYAGVFHKNTNVLMGFLSAGSNQGKSDFEIAFGLHQHYWGKGFLEEVIVPFMGTVFAAGVGAVIATSALDNYSSVRVLRTMNFVEVGTKEIPTPNGPRPSRVFRLTPEAWRKAVILPLGDGASAEEIKQRRQELRKILSELKARRG